MTVTAVIIVSALIFFGGIVALISLDKLIDYGFKVGDMRYCSIAVSLAMIMAMGGVFAILAMISSIRHSI